MLFKDIYNRDFLERMTHIMQCVNGPFEGEKFLNDIFVDEWEEKELKQRMRHIATTIHKYLPSEFHDSIRQLRTLLKRCMSEGLVENTQLFYMFIPDFIELYGIDYFDEAVSAMEDITEFASCEFAVRPFIIKYQGKMLSKMKAWTVSENKHVRRLASEACRPRLPWAMSLPDFKQDPSPILPIIAALRNDSSEYVRRSVSNNLNDISKDNPQLVIDLSYQWMDQSENTNRLLKHACRTLLKQGNREVMRLFGFEFDSKIVVSGVVLKSPKIALGDYLHFSFDLENRDTQSRKIRVEYAIYYMKKSGELSKKVYKLSEKKYDAQSLSSIQRKQAFKPISTRKFHPGRHKLAIVVNGVELESYDFELMM